MKALLNITITLQPHFDSHVSCGYQVEIPAELLPLYTKGHTIDVFIGDVNEVPMECEITKFKSSMFRGVFHQADDLELDVVFPLFGIFGVEESQQNAGRILATWVEDLENDPRVSNLNYDETIFRVSKPGEKRVVRYVGMK